MSFKIRFNLGRGDNYQKWQITNNSSGKVIYLTPELFNLELSGCTLRNQKGTAKKIHEDSNKTVCAWIDFDNITIREIDPIVGQMLLKYNPRVNPNWTCDDENVDGKKFKKLATYKRNIYTEEI